jgi:hypothetical protein
MTKISGYMEDPMAIRLSELLKSKAINIRSVQRDEAKLANEFNLDTQERSQWCWVAVAIGVARYFHVPDLLEDQCTLAGTITNCHKCKDPLCNVTGDVDRALIRQGIKAAPVQGAPAFDYLVNEIDADRPVICDMKDDNADFHSVVVCHCYRHTGKIDMLDPKTDLSTDHIGFWEGYSRSYDLIVDRFNRYFMIEDPR